MSITTKRRRRRPLANARGVFPLTVEFLLLAFFIVLFAIAYAQMFNMGTASWDAYTDAWNDGRTASLRDAGGSYRLHRGTGRRTVSTYPWFRPVIGAAPVVRRTIYVPGGSSADRYGARPRPRPRGIY